MLPLPEPNSPEPPVSDPTAAGDLVPEQPEMDLGMITRNLLPGAMTGNSPEYQRIAEEPSLVGRLAAAMPASGRHATDIGLTALEYTTLGDVYDIMGSLLGRDLLTGMNLEPWMRGMAFFPIFGAGLGLKRSLHKLDWDQQAQVALQGTRRGTPLNDQIHLDPAALERDIAGTARPSIEVKQTGETIPMSELPASTNPVGTRIVSRLFHPLVGAHTFEQVGDAIAMPQIVAIAVGGPQKSVNRTAMVRSFGVKLVTDNRSPHFDIAAARGGTLEQKAVTAVKNEMGGIAAAVEAELIVGDRAAELYRNWDRFVEGDLKPGTPDALKLEQDMFQFSTVTGRVAYLDPELAIDPRSKWQAIGLNEGSDFRLTMYHQTEPYYGRMEPGYRQKMGAGEKGIGVYPKGTKAEPRTYILNDRGPYAPEAKTGGVRFVDGPEITWNAKWRGHMDYFRATGRNGDILEVEGLGDLPDIQVRLKVTKMEEGPALHGGSGNRKLEYIAKGDPEADKQGRRTWRRAQKSHFERRGDRLVMVEGAVPRQPWQWAALEDVFTKQLLRNVHMALWWDGASEVAKKEFMASYDYYRTVIEEVNSQVEGSLANHAGRFALMSSRTELENNNIPGFRDISLGRSKPVSNVIDGKRRSQLPRYDPNNPDPSLYNMQSSMIDDAYEMVQDPNMIGTMPNDKWWAVQGERLSEWADSAKAGDKITLEPDPMAKLDKKERIVFRMSPEKTLELVGGDTHSGEKLRNYTIDSSSRGYNPRTNTFAETLEELEELERKIGAITNDVHNWSIVVGANLPGRPPQFQSRAAYTTMNNAYTNVWRMHSDVFANPAQVQALPWNWWRAMGGGDPGTMVDDMVIRVLQGRAEDNGWASMLSAVTEDGAKGFEVGKTDKLHMSEGVYASMDQQGNGTIAAPVERRGALTGLYPLRNETIKVGDELWPVWAPIRMRRVTSVVDEAKAIVDGASSDGKKSRLTGYSIYSGSDAAKLAHMHGTRRIKISIPEQIAEHRIQQFVDIARKEGLIAGDGGDFQYTTTATHSGVSTAWKAPPVDELMGVANRNNIEPDVALEAVVRLDPQHVLVRSDKGLAVELVDGRVIGDVHAGSRVEVELPLEWQPEVEHAAQVMYREAKASPNQHSWNNPTDEFRRTVLDVAEISEPKVALWVMPNGSRAWDRLIELLHQPLVDHADTVGIDMSKFKPEWAIDRDAFDMYPVPSTKDSVRPDTQGWRVKDNFGEEALDMVLYPADDTDLLHTNQWLHGSGLGETMTPVYETWMSDGGSGALSHMVEHADDHDPYVQQVYVMGDFYQMVEGSSNDHLMRRKVAKGRVDPEGRLSWGNEFEVPREATMFAEEIYGSDTRNVRLELEGARHALDVNIKYYDGAIDEAVDPSRWKTRKPTYAAVVIPANPIDGPGGRQGVAQIAYDQDNVADFFLRQGVLPSEVVLIKFNRKGGRLRSLHLQSTSATAMELARHTIERTGSPESMRWTYERLDEALLENIAPVEGVA